MKSTIGRRAAKAKKAGLPKAKKAKTGVTQLPQAAEEGARTLRVNEGVAAAPARWTAAEKRARRAAAAAAAAAQQPEEPSVLPVPRSQPASRSQHGSHFVTGAVESGRVNDEWQTSLEAWSELAPLLAHWKSRSVWMPFYYDGVCAEHLSGLGFETVLHERGADFFERAKETRFLKQVDLVLDNPPYTSPETKDAVLRALVATKKSFCVLLPASVLFTQLFRDIVPTDGVQLILPRRVKVCKTGGPPVPFKQMAWICCKSLSNFVAKLQPTDCAYCRQVWTRERPQLHWLLTTAVVSLMRRLATYNLRN
jgi:hypothetical protein